MKVAVLGGGPAGAFAATRLATAGVETVLFDEKLAWEKPCGGGITYKAYTQYPFLLENDAPKRFVQQTVLAAPGAAPATLRLDHPLLIYSRFDLNGMLLQRAAAAGARLEKTRVLGITRAGPEWTVQTRDGSESVDFFIVATGARNPLRNAGTELTAGDTMSALGYYVPGEREGIDLQFLPHLDGYIWVFPRAAHMSVGICGKGETAAALRTRLETWMAEPGLSKDGATFYAHLLPALESGSWQQNRVAGDGWLAVGDAAGLVDPITGEGIYYAIHSADLAVEALLSRQDAPGDAYQELLRRDMTEDLEFASRVAHRVFHGSVFAGPITTRMVQFTRRSPKFRGVMQDLFDGTQPYTGLKRRLVAELPRSLWEVGISLMSGRY